MSAPRTCDCGACRKCEHRDYEAWRYRKRAMNQWVDPLVDAKTARDHLRFLAENGTGTLAVAKKTGLNEKNLQRIRSGKARRVTRRSERRILAARPTPPRPAIGVARRLQALTALGWTQTHIATQLGVHKSRVSQLASGVHRTVTDEVWQAVKDVYDKLSMTPGPSWRTAARSPYPPPLAWDDDTIDNPDAQPWQPVTQTREGRPDTAAHVLDEYTFLTSCGESHESAATRLGVHPDTIRTYQWRAQQRTRETA